MSVSRRQLLAGGAALAGGAVVAAAAGSGPQSAASASVPEPCGTSPAGNPSGVAPTTSINGWQLDFTDDFDGNAVDSTRWAVYDSPRSTKPQGPKLARLAIVNGGVLTLRVTQAPELDNAWAGAGMSCRRTATWGRYQVRARYAHGANAKAVGLLWPQQPPGSHGNVIWPPEVDFIEYSAEDPDHSKVYFTNHYSDANLMQHASLALDSTVWHTFDVAWLPDGIRYRVDGQLIAAQTGHVPDVPMWLGLSNNLARSGARPDPTLTPAVDWDIDWVTQFKPTAARLAAAFAAVSER